MPSAPPAELEVQTSECVVCLEREVSLEQELAAPPPAGPLPAAIPASPGAVFLNTFSSHISIWCSLEIVENTGNKRDP